MAMKRVKDPGQSTNNWSAGMTAPGTQTKYVQGVQNVQQSPTALAASPEAEARYIQGVQASVTSGRRAAKLQAVSLDQWKQRTVNMGAPALAKGATKGKDKVQAHFQRWTPIYQQASDAAQALPKGGKANAMARISAAMDVLMSAAGKS